MNISGIANMDARTVTNGRDTAAMAAPRIRNLGGSVIKLTFKEVKDGYL